MQTRALHDAIVSQYEEYFQKAPTDWKTDPFFLEHRPTSVYYKSRKESVVNAEDARSDSVNQEADWARRFDWSKIATMSIGISTEYRYVISRARPPSALIELVHSVLLQCQNPRPQAACVYRSRASVYAWTSPVLCAAGQDEFTDDRNRFGATTE